MCYNRLVCEGISDVFMDITKQSDKWVLLNGVISDIDELKDYASLEKIVEFLNIYESKCRIKDTLIKSQSRKIKELEQIFHSQEDTILELKHENEEYRKKVVESDVNYWHGVEKTYEKIFHELYEKNINLERQNQALIDKLCEYEDEEI